MATTTLKFSKIGKEDLEIGTGTFEVELSDGRKATLNRINLSSFLTGDQVDTAIYFTNSTAVGQDADFVYDTSTKQMTMGDSSSALLIGSTGTASRMVHLAGVGDTGLRIDNSDAGAGDAILEWATHGVVDWHAYLDDSDGDNLKIGGGAVGSSTPHVVLVRTSGEVIIGSTDANSGMTTGLSIDQGSADDQILAFRNSDITHGVTDEAETDVFGFFQKSVALTGGLAMVGLTESVIAAEWRGVASAQNTTTADTSIAAMQIIGQLKSGTGVTDMGATTNILAVVNNGDAVVLFKGDGDVHNSGGSTAMSTYDNYDDIQLLETVKGAMDVNYRGTLGDWVGQNEAILERGGVISRSGDKWFISQRGWRGLCIDAIRQLASRIAELESRGAA